MIHLAMLADEMSALAAVLRDCGDDVALAARGLGRAVPQQLGPQQVDAAAGLVVDDAAGVLDRLGMTFGEMEQMLHRLSSRTGEVEGGV